MNSPTNNPRSLATKASWASLGLALASACIFLVFNVVDQISPFDQTRVGVLTGFLPRTVLLLTAVQNCGAGECRGGLILQRTDV